MRKMRKEPMMFAIAITAMLLFQSFDVLSQSNINLSLYKPGSEIARLYVTTASEAAPVSVTIKDEQGVILFTDQSKSENYVKLLDFSKIDHGRYFVDIAQPTKVIRKVVSKAESGLVIQQDSYYLFNNITSLQDDQEKLLVKINNKLNESVTVRITDSEGNVLHEETGIKAENYSTLFNLSQLSSGVYNMSLSSANFTNSRSFQIK